MIRRSAARIGSRWAALDPGLARWRGAWAATVCLGVTLAVEYVLSPVPFGGRGALTGMLVGGVAAMQASGALLHPSWRHRVRFAALQPVAAGAGLAAAVVVRTSSGFTGVLFGFVVLTFLAVQVRRLGPPFVIMGLLSWAGYYMGVVIRPPASELPYLLWAQVLAGVCSGVLSLTVFRHRPRASLRHALRAWRARGELLFAAACRLLEAPDRSSRARRFSARHAVLGSSALAVEGWLAYAPVFAPGGRAAHVRRRLLESQVAADSLAHAVRDLGGALDERPAHPAAARAQALGLLRPLARGEHQAAWDEALRIRAVRTPAGEADHDDALGVLADSALAFLRAGRDWQEEPLPEFAAVGFTPVAAPAATGVSPRARGADTAAGRPRLASLRRLLADVTTRYATQAALAVALAILLGRLISSTQYYWSLIAVFIVLLGPTTREQTLVKGAHRLIGTLAGCLAAVPVTTLLDGRSGPVICVVLVSCLLGHYLAPVSYTFLAFFITVCVFQTYAAMHHYESALVPTRLSETALGAALAVGMAFGVLPVRARDTVDLARSGFVQATSTLLDELAGTGSRPNADDTRLPLRIRQVDAHSHRWHAAVLMRPALTRADRSRTRAQVEAHRALTVALRHLTVSAPVDGRGAAATIAQNLGYLAHTVSRLGQDGPALPVLPSGNASSPFAADDEHLASLRCLVSAVMKPEVPAVRR
ncbi:FUSC family protein [Actinacidiphila sp. ITFR-21]|uniref:FUSC family protein n=1 Tax=Actinacidiphila sp. ITFR-21 TaxID=3075199 RepID=UPI0028894581|nr:FUSC family protein [Streptomyces sp. ITFR-21]WNI16200.1 FUSC family protein [Streptomyces sp. ITFR-21]